MSIRGYSELYRQGALPNEDAVATAMGRIEAESKRMGQLVEDLLTLARIDERRESKLAPFDMFHLAVDATNDAFATSPDREITLVGLTDDVAPCSAPVVGDEPRMRQVVANLLTNAMRYTPEGSPLEVAVGVRQEAPGCRAPLLRCATTAPVSTVRIVSACSSVSTAPTLHAHGRPGARVWACRLWPQSWSNTTGISVLKRLMEAGPRLWCRCRFWRALAKRSCGTCGAHGDGVRAEPCAPFACAGMFHGLVVWAPLAPQSFIFLHTERVCGGIQG
ncbi:osmosensitive K+ channel histidine kinase KdpD [Rothia aeria]|uniref:histidine kinase n=1 Tax=Rothia aeria TaxID=172042 RepID=A0A2Z5QVK3_9MICC|nr:osmosensitive K+ channel histidine kinase KdpD [Rothia aeria]